MADITKRISQEGEISYRVRIRLRGFPLQSATFPNKSKAKEWAQATEAAMREGRHFKHSESKKHTLGNLIDRYIRDVLPTKPRSERKQSAQLEWWKGQIGNYLLADVTPSLIVEQRDLLLQSKTVRGEPLTFYLKILKDKDYTYGKHLVPHDAAVHEYSSGLTRIAVARNLGVTFIQTPDLGVDEGIDAVRNVFNRCWFDEEKCSSGIRALESYRRQWNERHGCWSSHPLHNQSSHGADAFRMLAVGLKRVEEKGMTAQDAENLQRAYARDFSGLPYGHPLYTGFYPYR